MLNWLSTVIAALTALVVASVLLARYPELARRRGWLGVDVHKPNHPQIPERAGLCSFIAAVSGLSLALFLVPQSDRFALLAACLTITIAAAIGFIDDARRLGPISKPAILVIASIPLLAFVSLTRPHYRLILPVIGRVRLTYTYPLLVLASVPVASNAANMFDVLNGTLAGSSILILTTLTTCSWLLGESSATICGLVLLASLVPLYMLNRFPSRVFIGNVGAMFLGASIATVAVLGRIEAIAVLACSPMILNGFYTLSSLRRLRERHQILSRPIFVKDGLLYASPNPSAPLTIVRLVLAEGPLKENQVIRILHTLVLISCIFASIIFLIWWL